MIDETVRCVLEEGFAPPSVRRIADRAGLTWGVVQYHFGDLDGLLMAVVDKGFGELIETLARLPAVGPATPTHDRVAFVVDAVWHAFSSPTSMAALEILISTRSMRDAVANTHLAEIMKTFTVLGRQMGEGLDAPDATEVGNLIWATLRGLVVAQMVSPHPVDSTRDRRALVDVISGYLRSTSKEETGPGGPFRPCGDLSGRA